MATYPDWGSPTGWRETGTGNIVQSNGSSFSGLNSRTGEIVENGNSRFGTAQEAQDASHRNSLGIQPSDPLPALTPSEDAQLRSERTGIPVDGGNTTPSESTPTNNTGADSTGSTETPSAAPSENPAAADGGMTVSTADGHGSSLNPLSSLNGGSGGQVIKVYPESSGGYSHGHYIVFHVNEQTSTQWTSPGSRAHGPLSGLAPGIQGIVNRGMDQINSSIASINQTGSATVAERGTYAGVLSAVTGAVSDVAGSVFGSTGIAKARAAVDALPGRVNAVGNQINASITDGVNKLLTRPTTRTNTTIALYMPDTINFDQSIDYNSDSMSTAFGSLATAASIAAVFSGNVMGSNGSPSNKAAMLLVAASSIANGTTREQGKNIVLQNVVGVAENPQNVLLFNQVDFRTFQFDFLLTPESTKESASILEIIKLFRMNSLPDVILGTAGRFFTPPNDFSISFMNNGTINTKLPKLSKCVLRRVLCDYAVNGIWQTYADGMPTQIRMSLLFEEAEILTKSKVAAGY